MRESLNSVEALSLNEVNCASGMNLCHVRKVQNPMATTFLAAFLMAQELVVHHLDASSEQFLKSGQMSPWQLASCLPTNRHSANKQAQHDRKTPPTSVARYRLPHDKANQDASERVCIARC